VAAIDGQPDSTNFKDINIQWFAIQEWKQAGNIIMQYVRTGDNSADADESALMGSTQQACFLWKSIFFWGIKI
jgi:hypothetical protein